VRVTDEDAGVTGYVPSTGGLTWARALDNAASEGDEFELHQLMDPDELDRRINTAITRLYYVNEELITVVSGQREYSLSDYTWLTRPGQVLDILWIKGSTALKKTYPPVNWFRIEEDAGALTLHIEPYAQETGGQQMVLLAQRPYTELSQKHHLLAAPRTGYGQPRSWRSTTGWCERVRGETRRCIATAGTKP